MNTQGPLMQARFFEIYHVFEKKRSDTFVTEYVPDGVLSFYCPISWWLEDWDVYLTSLDMNWQLI